MVLVLDQESFTAPLMEAIAATGAAFVNAGETVRGAARRAEQAMFDQADLRDFQQRVAGLIRDRGFGRLPRLRHQGRPVENCHHLTVGPWRGIFLVAQDGGDAIGLLFSRAPHDVYPRLAELIAARAAPPKETPPPETPSGEATSREAPPPATPSGEAS